MNLEQACNVLFKNINLKYALLYASKIRTKGNFSLQNIDLWYASIARNSYTYNEIVEISTMFSLSRNVHLPLNIQMVGNCW